MHPLGGESAPALTREGNVISTPPLPAAFSPTCHPHATGLTHSGCDLCPTGDSNTQVFMSEEIQPAAHICAELPRIEDGFASH